VLVLALTVSALLTSVTVGSEEARRSAGLRPPLKLRGRFSRMQLSRRRDITRCERGISLPPKFTSSYSPHSVALGSCVPPCWRNFSSALVVRITFQCGPLTDTSRAVDGGTLSHQWQSIRPWPIPPSARIGPSLLPQGHLAMPSAEFGDCLVVPAPTAPATTSTQCSAGIPTLAAARSESAGDSRIKL